VNRNVEERDEKRSCPAVSYGSRGCSYELLLGDKSRRPGREKGGARDEESGRRGVDRLRGLRGNRREGRGRDLEESGGEQEGMRIEEKG
jgi:hypothetical protein